MEDLKIGHRCSLGYCNQKDFLPFKCKLCSMHFCHPHMTDHECSQKNTDDKLAMKCPTCHETIKYTGADDAEEVLKRHQAKSTCVAKPKQKSSHCVSCKLKLTLINKYSCNSCRQETCLKHRAASDHQCVPLLAPAAESAWRREVACH